MDQAASPREASDSMDTSGAIRRCGGGSMPCETGEISLATAPNKGFSHP